MNGSPPSDAGAAGASRGVDTVAGVDVVLSDGATVHLRPIRPDDADRLVALHGRLSPTSVYYRFFSVKPRLSEAEVHRFTNVDGHDRVALVAALGDDLVAVGRYDRWGGHDEAEVAFTVDDAHQGRGLGSVLLEHLAAIGRANGLRRFTAQVLPENRSMLSVFRSAGFEVRRSFEGGVVDLVFPIEVTPAVLATLERREQRADAASIARLLHPGAIAVFGASDRPDSVGGRVLATLVGHGFAGTVHPVNPRRPVVAGLTAVADLDEIEGDVDLAVVAVPGAQVPAVLDACARRGVRGALVISVLDAGAGVSAAELATASRRRGMRLVGPGSFGVVEQSGLTRLNATIAGTLGVERGRAAVSVQSGPLAGAVLELAHRVGLGVGSFVSLGDAADVGAADLLNHWADDDAVGVALLYVEGYGDPRRFARVARRFSLRKPLVAVRAGLSGDDAAAAEALERRAGVVRVGSVRQLVDVGRLLANQALPSAPGAAIVTNSTSAAVLAADALRARGLPVIGERPAAAAPERYVATGASAGVGRSTADRIGVDLGPTAGRDDYASALAAVLADPTVPAVLVIYAPPLDPDPAVLEVIDAVGRGAGRPVVAVALGRGDGPLVAGGVVPAFAFPEPAAYVLGAAWQYATWRRAVAAGEHDDQEGDIEATAGADGHETVRAAAALLAGGAAGTVKALADLSPLLRAAGLTVAEAVPAPTPELAVAAAGRVGYPVALKMSGVARRGRSEAGGVALDLFGDAEVRAAFARMAALAPGAAATAVVQPMAPPGVEVRVAVDNHPAYGPVVSVGLGGLYAGAMGGVRRCAAPVDRADALALVSEPLAEALAQAGASVESVVALALAAGRLADQAWELDSLVLNPVLVGEHGAVVVDAAATVTERPEPQAGLTRHV